MASSPTEETLEHLVGAYDLALDALIRADLARVRNVLDSAQAALAELQDPERDSDRELALRRRAWEGHARLAAAMRSSRREILMELKKVREGRMVLKTYGNRTEALGTRLQSEG